MDPGSQGVQGCPSRGMGERGEGNGGCNRGDGLPPGPGNGGCNRSDGLPPVPGTPSQQSRSQGSGMDGQTPEGNVPPGFQNTMPQQQPQQQQTNVSQNAQGFASTTNLDASGQGYPGQGCQQGNMPVMQGQGPAWFGAQWIPQQPFMQQTAQARVPSFGCASMPGGPRSGGFPNLGVSPMNYQGNMPSGPVGATLGGLTPQAAQIQEVMAMLGNLNEGQLQTVQQHMQDRFVAMQQRRGVPEVFGDGLGRAADSSFVTPQPLISKTW